MIRTACLAATLLASALLPVESASATVTLNGRISQIVNALHKGSTFAPGSFSFTISNGATTKTLFTGIEGVRGFTDLAGLNTWVNDTQPPSVFQGGEYKFTHSVLSSYFGTPPAPAVGARMTPMSVMVEPLDVPATGAVPEPASWAMMIGGFALAGAAMRRRTAAVRVA